MTTYSFRDLAGAFMHPNTGSFILAGPELGIGQIVVRMHTDRTAHDVSADGNVMVSYIPGDNGTLEIEMQQTCILNEFLVGWFNGVKTEADNGYVANWAGATVSLRNLVDGSNHLVSGVSPLRIPDKTYTTQGQKITWSLMAASIITQ